VLRGGAPALERRFAALRERLEVPESFPPEVERAADEAVRRGPLPAERDDLRDVQFVTIDPPGSRDLDQALSIESAGDGYRVRYAIADVGAWVPRDGVIDAEAWRRGATLYAPDRRATLYPPALSEGAASLLPDGERPAIVLELELDARGERTGFRARRAIVRSRRQLTYAEVVAGVVPGLDVVGELLAARAAERGAIELDAPVQAIVADDGPAGYTLVWEERVASEAWNAQISLAANAAVAASLVERGTGIVRAMAPPDAGALRMLHTAAATLALPWPPDLPLGAMVRGLAPGPRRASFVIAARRALGAARYQVLEGPPSAADRHAAVGGLYAHATAPLRRLADRYLLDLLVGVPADRTLLQRLAATMDAADARAARYERELLDLVESAALAPRVGEVFAAVVLAADARSARIQIAEPPIVTTLSGADGLAAGDAVRVRLVEADADAGRVVFARA
jgi:exoribonuclease R